MFVKIKGTGSCLPEKVLDNFEISQLVDTNDEWIQSRTGIKSRHIAREETAVSMAAKAAKRALEDAQVAAEEIDLPSSRYSTDILHRSTALFSKARP